MPKSEIASSDYLVYVPVFNEENTIAGVIQNIREFLGEVDILIVDDASLDSSAVIARDLGAIVISHAFNIGVGGALSSAIEFALQGNYQGLIQLDGDGQHQLDHKFVANLTRKGDVSLVIGNRFHAASEYRISRTRKFAIDVLRYIIRKRLKLDLHDPTSGFRYFHRSALEALRDKVKFEYLQDTVLVIKLLAETGFSIEEVDSNFSSRSYGESSIRKLGLVKAYLRTACLLLV